MASNEMVKTAVSIADILSSAGIDFDTTQAKSARRVLNQSGAISLNISDEIAVAASRITKSLKAADSQIKTACYYTGALRVSEAWKDATDDSGKPFKSENAFLKALLPGYATSTVSLYADVGATIYLPVARGEMPDLQELGNLSPSNAKFLLAAVKDADKRKALPAAIQEAKEVNGGKLTQKAIASAVKSLSPSNAKPESVSTDAATIADELSGGAASVTLAKLMTWTYNGDDKDGDLTAIVLERDIDDFKHLLEKAKNDSNAAVALVGAMLSLVNKAR